MGIPENAKAWISLLGAIVTALLGLGVIPTGSFQTILTIISALCTSVATWATPNRQPVP